MLKYNKIEKLFAIKKIHLLNLLFAKKKNCFYKITIL